MGGWAGVSGMRLVFCVFVSECCWGVGRRRLVGGCPQQGDEGTLLPSARLCLLLCGRHPAKSLTNKLCLPPCLPGGNSLWVLQALVQPVKKMRR